MCLQTAVLTQGVAEHGRLQGSKQDAEPCRQHRSAAETVQQGAADSAAETVQQGAADSATLCIMAYQMSSSMIFKC